MKLTFMYRLVFWVLMQEQIFAFYAEGKKQIYKINIKIKIFKTMKLAKMILINKRPPI